mmetsp:Transcript_32006/g.46921  ORF Transcript_32006/g.46921 Transcript_32006/m.46921 type:complete len:1121 (+) Transcript_32006:247-3609(+)
MPPAKRGRPSLASKRKSSIPTTTSSSSSRGVKKRSLASLDTEENKNAIVPATDAVEEVQPTKKPKNAKKVSVYESPVPVSTPEDKENVGTPTPGATPYWKVAAERGFSPRLTRSTTKKNKRRLEHELDDVSAEHTSPKDDDDAAHVALFFSPPNQARNRAREKEAKKRYEMEKHQRIQRAKDKGELLIFSNPNGKKKRRPNNHNNSSSSIASGDSSSPSSLLSPTAEEHSSSLVPTSNDIISKTTNATTTNSSPKVVPTTTILEGQIKEMIQKGFQNANMTTQEEMKQFMETKIQNTHLTSTVAKLETSMEQLRAQYTELLEKYHIEKDELLQTSKETLVKEKEWEAMKIKMDMEAKREIAAMEDVVKAKNSEITTLKELRNANMEALSTENKRLLEEMEKTMTVYEKLVSEREDLMQKLHEAEQKLDIVKTNHECNADEAKLRATMEQEMNQMNKQVKDLQEKLQKSKEENNALEDKVIELECTIEQTRNDLCELQSKEAEANAYNLQLKKEVSTKNRNMENLSEELMETKKQLDRVTAKLGYADQNSKAFEEKLKNSTSGQKEAEGRIEELMKELERAKLAREDAKQAEEEAIRGKDDADKRCHDVTSALGSLEKNLQQEKERNDTMQSEIKQRASMSQHEVDELKEKLVDMEHQLSAVQRERDEAKEEKDAAIEHSRSFEGRELALQSRICMLEGMRRGLHNRVMQLSGNIRVFVRVRPRIQCEIEQLSSSSTSSALVTTSSSSSSSSSNKGNKKDHRRISRALVPMNTGEEDPFNFPGMGGHDGSPASTSSNSTSSSFADDITKNLLEVTEPYKDRGGLNPRRKKWKFGFDHVFSPSQTQDDVWDAAEPLVQSAIDGFNVCIFAYGQTGSGKTYTMLGEPQNPGITSRSVRKLFKSKEEIEASSKGATSVHISVELLEIYNEQVRDLLGASSTERANLQVNANEAVGNVMVSASSEEEVAQILSLAQSRRCVKATKSNAASSRGHLLFTIHFQVKNNNGKGVNRYGKLHVVDLAGSERINKSGAQGSLLKEAQHINKSLSTLSNVIEKLQTKQSHIPYRESKLTNLLQNSLGGDSKTAAIICCSPLSVHFNESLCSLRFAEKVNRVELKAGHNFSC